LNSEYKSVYLYLFKGGVYIKGVVYIKPKKQKNVQFFKMDMIKAVQGYITKITGEVSGMKVLLLDKDTVGLANHRRPLFHLSVRNHNFSSGKYI
jgi:hypothetical protein